MSHVKDMATEKIAARVRGVKAEHRLTDEQIALIIGVADRKTVGSRLKASTAFTAAELFRLATATNEPIIRFFPECAS